MATDPTCISDLDTAYSPAAGHLTVAYADKAVFTLKRDDSGELALERQQTRFPSPVTKMRALQTSAFAFQVSGLVAAIDREDSRTVWIGSLLFPQVEPATVSEAVVDVAWRRTAPHEYRVQALTRTGLVEIECAEKKGKVVVGKVIPRFSFPAAPTRVWDRVFPVNAEITYLLDETGTLGRLEGQKLTVEKFADWVHSARMAEVDGVTYLCGVFVRAGKKQTDTCFQRTAEGIWGAAITPAPLVLPPTTGGTLGELIVEPSFPMRVLLRQERP